MPSVSKRKSQAASPRPDSLKRQKAKALQIVTKSAPAVAAQDHDDIESDHDSDATPQRNAAPHSEQDSDDCKQEVAPATQTGNADAKFASEIDDATLSASMDKFESDQAAASSAATPRSGANSVVASVGNGQPTLVNPNDALLRIDAKLNLVYPALVDANNKPRIYVKVKEYGDRAYININSGKQLKQSLTKFGELPPIAYGVKFMLPFSVISADPLPHGQCRNRFTPGHPDYQAPAVPSIIPVPPLHKSNFTAQVRFDDLYSDDKNNAALEEWVQKIEPDFLALVMPMLLPHISSIDKGWNDQIEADLESRNINVTKANKIKYLIENTASFVRKSAKGLRYIPLKFRLFGKAKDEQKLMIEAGQAGQGVQYQSIWNDPEMAQVVRDSVTRVRTENSEAKREPMTVTELPILASRMLKAEERTEKTAPFVTALTPQQTIELMGRERNFIGSAVCQLGIELVKEKETKRLSFKCVLQPLNLIFHQALSDARQSAQALLEQMEEDLAEDLDFGI
jgi:hypothetical protein